MSALASDGSISDTYTGGFPTISQDLAPCILFAVLYLITTVICIWRTVRYRRSRRMIGSFIRLNLFEFLRVTTMILRAVDGKNIQDTIEGKGNFNEGLFIGEQVLISIGYLWLASTLNEFTVFHELRGQDWKTAKKQRRFTRFTDLILFVAGILLSATAYDYSNPTYRKVSTILTLLALVAIFVYNVHLSRVPHLPKKTSYWLCLTTLLLIVVPCYRLSTLFNPPTDASSGGRKAEFYILQITVEWLVGVSILSINVKKWCGVEDDVKPGDKSTSAETLNMQQTEKV